MDEKQRYHNSSDRHRLRASGQSGHKLIFLSEPHSNIVRSSSGCSISLQFNKQIMIFMSRFYWENRVLFLYEKDEKGPQIYSNWHLYCSYMHISRFYIKLFCLFETKSKEIWQKVYISYFFKVRAPRLCSRSIIIIFL